VAATYSSLIGVAVGGKYEIRRVLGAGGMGVVCEAVHLDLGKRVAIKLIDKSMKESELIVARFRREARAAGQINSEHIVDVFDVGADARVGLYMVMEHLAGEDLQGRLEKDKRIDIKTGVMIAHQIARGLAKAHEAGVIHRDLKPANVYLTERDNGQMLVKLLDFGVSKLLSDAPGSARITGSGTPIGTPLYMSPEQAEGKDDVDGRADIWSLGAVLYESLAGAPPFADRGSYHGTIVGILTSRPKLLHDAAPWVPPELARVVDAMLVHDRDARIPNAAAVTQRLLDAFPSVLPDGTGKHTAVIVAQNTTTVDATGDTEVFTAAAMAAAAARISRPSGTPGSGVGVGSGRGATVSGPPAPPSNEPSARSGSGIGSGGGGGGGGGARSQQDSLRTVSDNTDATRTAAATPVDLDRTGVAKPYEPSTGGSGPKTAPLPPTPSSRPYVGSGPNSSAPLPPISSDPRSFRNTLPTPTPGPAPRPSSSAGGVAMPGTPPIIEPLPMSEVAPVTERDDILAVRAERRRWLTIMTVLLAIAGVAIGGFLAGRRATKDQAPAPASAPSPSAAPSASPSASSPSSPSPQPTAESAPGITPSALPSATAIPPVPHPALKRRPPRPATSATATPTDPSEETKPTPAPPPTVPE